MPFYERSIMACGCATVSTSLPVLGILFAVLVLSSSPSEAIEKWERSLGWNPQYGPRYTVFWDRRSGSKDLPLGTCSYGHYAATPLPTEPHAEPFVDFHIAHLKKQDNSFSNISPQEVSPLKKLARMAFYEVRGSVRYAQLKGSQLPLDGIKNVPAVIEAVKTFGAQLCFAYLGRLQRSSDQSTLAKLLNDEGGQLLSVLRLLHQAIREAQNFNVEMQAPAVYDLLKKVVKEIRGNEHWDAPSFAYWVDATNGKTESGGSYYVEELETARWELAMAALAASPPADRSYADLQPQRENFKDCFHFQISRRAAHLKGREHFCRDAFFSLSRVLVEKIKSLATDTPQGTEELMDSIRNAEEAIKRSSFTMSPESPFYSQPTHSA